MKKFQLFVFIVMTFSQPLCAGADLFENVQYQTAPEHYQKITVSRVISADLIELETGEQIKLIGLKAPEPPKRTKDDYDEYGHYIRKESPLTSIEERAFLFAKNLLEGEIVRVEFDANKKNEDFQTVAYVYILKNNLFVNAEILRQGYASLHIRPPNIKYRDLLRSAYQEARQEKRGLQGE